MKITNKKNISQSLYDAIVAVNNKYTKGSADFSVTELIGPARIRVLKKKHSEELEEDVSDMIWRFLGHLVHGAIENMNNENVLAEERLFAYVNGIMISGAPDRFDGKAIIDYKLTSKYAVKEGIKIEWEQQLNLYRYLFACNGFEVQELWVEAILKDAVRDEDKVKRMQAPLWPLEGAESYLKERIAIHVDADRELPLCSREERWSTPEKWAVHKKGRKSALKLYNNEDEAERHIDNLGSQYYVDYRKGEDKRCQDYCIVSKFCEQNMTGATS